MIDIQKITALPPLRDVIKENDLAAKKSLGQNFLLDLNMTCRIARSAGDLTNINAIEIGPGPGGLTRAILMQSPKSLTAIERDDRCIRALAPVVQAADGGFKLIAEDALKCDLSEIVPPPRAILANLPYNIATPLLINWLKKAGDFEHFTLMFQKEVADRIVAQPSTKAYGRLAVIAQYCCEAEIVYNLPPSAFTPPPKVDSAVVHLIPKFQPDPDFFAALEKVTEAAFGQRRKMLRASLKKLSPNSVALLEQLGIDPTLRAENLSVQQFIDLTKCYLESLS